MKIALLALALLPFSATAFAGNKVEVRTLCLAFADRNNSEATRLELEAIHRTGGSHRRYNVDLTGRIAGLGQLTGGANELSEEEFAALKEARAPVLQVGVTVFNGEGYDSINRYAGELAVSGSLARPVALTLDLKRIGLEGTHPIAGPAQLELSVGDCE